MTTFILSACLAAGSGSPRAGGASDPGSAAGPPPTAARAGDEKGDSIEGAWLPTAAELGGRKFPDEVRKTIRLVVEGDRYTTTVGGEVDRGSCKLDPAAKPKALDITGTEGPNKGRTIPAIYERDGDTLRICYNLAGPARPTEFATKPGGQLFLVTYRREGR